MPTDIDHTSVIPSYTGSVKTAISLPDETFDRVSRAAAQLGISRSEFFATAARRYLDQLDAQSLTSEIDGALDRIDGTDESASDAVSVGHRVLGDTDGNW